MTYRPGNHQPRNLYRGDQYIGVCFDPADTALIVDAMEGRARALADSDGHCDGTCHGHTPDVDYAHGAREALGLVADRIADLDGTVITMRVLRQVLEAAVADLGVDEDTPCTPTDGTCTCGQPDRHHEHENAPPSPLSSTLAAQTGPARGSGSTEATTAVSAAVAITAKRANEAEDVRRRITEHAEHRPSSLGGDGLGYGPCVGCAKLWPCPVSRNERKADQA